MPLRPARPADIARLIAIRAAVRENRLADTAAIAAADYAPFIEAGRLWVAEAKGPDGGAVIIGFAALDAATASIWALFVAPEAEGRGAGRLLLERLVEDARRIRLPALSLGTQPDSRAERLYRAARWLPAGRDSKGNLLMRVAL